MNVNLGTYHESPERKGEGEGAGYIVLLFL
jgi:hypothetical protein